MAVMKILRLGDETLRKKSHPVTKIDRRTIGLLKDMAETMYAADGCGLAAPQVGILRRMVVIDVGDGLIELINPEIIESEGEEIGVEGCLSVPGRRGTVKRPTKVVVRALDKKGREIELTAEGFLARAVCHELDHLDGTVYVDKMIEDVTDQYNQEYHQEEN
ncbi:MAG: peptide deformylase [Clostridiales bacterium]|nr:peptide deformylase [Clostridiales bacterium]MDD6872018.1 peptide deformylase [Clostridiales bacterium]MDD7366292.1 peptide deformylase [Clostridiales bacterium]MDY2871341.1 peptide deformylase [Eubacteriales bacterium]